MRLFGPLRPAVHPATDRTAWIWLLTGAVVAAYIAGFAVALPGSSYSIIGGLATTPAVVVIGLLLALALGRRAEDPWVRRIIIGGYVLKLAASAGFYWLVFYGPGGDAGGYHRAGAEIAGAVWGGDLSALVSRGTTGTPAMEQLAGALYSVTGPAAATGFAVFATLSFIGSYLFYRALTLTVPNGRHRLYAALVFLLPSMLFWPASLGKEAWLILMLGLASYGGARLLTGRRGVVALLVGVLGAGVLRPHMAALTLAALAAAPLVPRRSNLSPRQRRGRFVLLLVVLSAGGAATIAAQRTFGLSSVSPAAVAGFLEVVSENTATGGSQFANVETVNPLLSPIALGSVLLRPFPHEAVNATMLLASLESVFVALLVWQRRRTVFASLRSAFRDPYVTYALVYTVLFALSYSFFNNLGLLARERVQLLPLFFVLLATALGARRHGENPERHPSANGRRLERVAA